MIKVLIVDGSAKARKVLATILRADPSFAIVGEAQNGQEALAMVARLLPNVIAMSIDLPGCNGFETTKKIMGTTPTPIILLKNEADHSPEETAVKALDAGALAVLSHASSENPLALSLLAGSLLWNLRTMSKVRMRKSPTVNVPRESSKKISTLIIPRPLAKRRNLIAIGASTGGPQAIRTILEGLDEEFTSPILLVQHIGEGFSHGFVRWLSGFSSLRVKLAEQGEFIAPKTIYVAPENQHLGVTKEMAIQLDNRPPVSSFRPSITYLFQSVAEHCGKDATAILLSGMGEDGVEGLRDIKRTGGLVIAQDEASSVIFGMSARAVQEGLVDQILTPKEITDFLKEESNAVANESKQNRYSSSKV